MIEVSPLRIGEKTAIGLRVELPDSPPLLMIIGQTGFVGCGFINIDAAEKLNVAVATVTCVKSFEDVLNAIVKAVTSKAQTEGVRVGMKGKEAVKLLL
ncbi:MAG: YunC family protein [Candidatus Bathyarchaeia archaeon]